MVTCGVAAIALVTPARASQDPPDETPGTQPPIGSIDVTPFDGTVPLGTQPPQGSVDLTPFDGTVPLGTQPPNPNPVLSPKPLQDQALVELAAQDLGDPNYVSPPDEGDPNANGQDEPPQFGS